MNNQLKINNMKDLHYKKLKRIVVVLLVALTIFSCKEDNSIERRITNAMEEYARTNFDDPRDLKEIVLIERTNVFDIDSLARQVLGLSKEIDSLEHDMRSQIDGDSTLLAELEASPQLVSRMRKNMTDSERARLFQLFIKIASYTSSDYVYKRFDLDNNFKLAMQNIDSVLNNNSFYSIDQYEIRVRRNSNEGLKLETYYTYLCDTTTNIIISDHETTIPELGYKTLYLKNQIDALYEYGQQKLDLVTDEKKNMDEASFIIREMMQ